MGSNPQKSPQKLADTAFIYHVKKLIVPINILLQGLHDASELVWKNIT